MTRRTAASPSDAAPGSADPTRTSAEADDLRERIAALLVADPAVVWTPARLVAATGAAPEFVVTSTKELVAAGRALDTAPKGAPLRVRAAPERVAAGDEAPGTRPGDWVPAAATSVPAVAGPAGDD